MNREELIRMAREAGALHDGPLFVPDAFALRFAELVAKAERKRICNMLLDMHAKEERHNYFLFISNIIKESQ